MAITLKGARVNAGYTQEKAGELLGVTSVTIGSWERGKTYPKIDQVAKIAALYGVGINDLIFLQKKST